MRRNRFVYFLAGCSIVPLGLASRHFDSSLPVFVSEYAGDTLWALMAFVTIAFVAPCWPSLRVACAALATSFGVELSQLYHAPWIDAARRTTVGGLLLGYGFLWSDLVCYCVGVLLALVLDRILTKPTPSK